MIALRTIWREPLLRLLLVNLAAGLFAAAMLFGGLLLLNPAGLRDLILSDHSPQTAGILLLFGLCVTFGSAAMGAAIMAIGDRDDTTNGGTAVPASVPAGARSKIGSRGAGRQSLIRFD